MKKNTSPHWKTFIETNDDNNFFQLRREYNDNDRAAISQSPPLKKQKHRLHQTSPSSPFFIFQSFLFKLLLVSVFVGLVSIFEYSKYQRCEMEISKRQLDATIITLSPACNDEYDRYHPYLDCSEIKINARRSLFPLVVSCWIRSNFIYELLDSVHGVLIYVLQSWLVRLIFGITLSIYPVVWFKRYFLKNDGGGGGSDVEKTNRFLQLFLGQQQRQQQRHHRVTTRFHNNTLDENDLQQRRSSSSIDGNTRIQEL